MCIMQCVSLMTESAGCRKSDNEVECTKEEVVLLCRFEPSFSVDNLPYMVILRCYFFPKPPLLARLFRQYCLGEIPDKHKNKLM